MSPNHPHYRVEHRASPTAPCLTGFFGKTALGLVFKALEHLPSLLSFQKALKTQTRPGSRRRFKHTHHSETDENGTSNLGAPGP